MSEEPDTATDAPTMAMIVMGNSLFFRPDSHVLSINVYEKEKLASCLQVEDESLESLHLVIKSNDVENLFDTEALGHIVEKLKPGAELTFHILSEGGTSGEDADTIKMAMVLSNVRLETEGQDEEGNKLIVGRKPGGPSAADDDDDSEDE